MLVSRTITTRVYTIWTVSVFSEGGVIATGGTKKCVVISTLKEAEFYADNGFEDILFGRPVSKDTVERFQ